MQYILARPKEDFVIFSRVAIDPGKRTFDNHGIIFAEDAAKMLTDYIEI